MKSYEYEERAAIKEYCGGMSREEAERQAKAELYPPKPKKPDQKGLFE